MEIINAFNSKTNKPLKLKYKRYLLYKLFFKGDKDLKPFLNIILSNIINPNISKQKNVLNDRIYCRDLKNKETCNNIYYCYFDRDACRFSIPEKYIEEYVFYLIEEILRLPIKQKQIINGEINSIINIEKLKANPDYFILDYSMYLKIKKLFDVSVTDRYDDVLKIFNVSNSIDKFYLNNLTNNDIKLKDNYQSEIKTLVNIDNHIIPVLKETNINYSKDELSNFWKSYLKDYFIFKSDLGNLFDILYIVLRNQKFMVRHPSQIKGCCNRRN